LRGHEYSPWIWPCQACIHGTGMMSPGRPIRREQGKTCRSSVQNASGVPTATCHVHQCCRGGKQRPLRGEGRIRGVRELLKVVEWRRYAASTSSITYPRLPRLKGRGGVGLDLPNTRLGADERGCNLVMNGLPRPFQGPSCPNPRAIRVNSIRLQ